MSHAVSFVWRLRIAVIGSVKVHEPTTILPPSETSSASRLANCDLPSFLTVICYVANLWSQSVFQFQH